MLENYKRLKKKFNSKNELVEYITDISPRYKSDKNEGTIKGGLEELDLILEKINVEEYSKTRNFIHGKVSKLSPFISRGMINEDQIIYKIREKTKNFLSCEKFIQQVCWRLFWSQVVDNNPSYIWSNVYSYKTGWKDNDYSNEMPDDILNANTKSEFINQVIKDLYRSGYIHNHLRLYLSSYIVHWRRIKWQVGAKWFLENLIDFDIASNNLSWQWVASTFSNKPYIFNLENIRKYCSEKYDIYDENNEELNHSYEDLKKILFPNKVQDTE